LGFTADGLVAGRFGAGFGALAGLLAFFMKVLLLLQVWCMSPVAYGFAFLLLGGLGGALFGLCELPATGFYFSFQSGHIASFPTGACHRVITVKRDNVNTLHSDTAILR
jgi:hypothetical protein